MNRLNLFVVLNGVATPVNNTGSGARVDRNNPVQDGLWFGVIRTITPRSGGRPFSVFMPNERITGVQGLTLLDGSMSPCSERRANFASFQIEGTEYTLNLRRANGALPILQALNTGNTQLTFTGNEEFVPESFGGRPETALSPVLRGQTTNVRVIRNGRTVEADLGNPAVWVAFRNRGAVRNAVIEIGETQEEMVTPTSSVARYHADNSFLVVVRNNAVRISGCIERRTFNTNSDTLAIVSEETVIERFENAEEVYELASNAFVITDDPSGRYQGLVTLTATNETIPLIGWHSDIGSFMTTDDPNDFGF